MYEDFIAGWVAGGTGLIVGHPLDTVKARLQALDGYKGIVDCVLKTLRNESIFGLYKGMLVPFLSTGATHSLLFAGYGAALRYLHPGESNVECRKDLPISDILIASVCGTLTQVGPVIPVELLKTKLQVQRESMASTKSNVYHGPIDCAKQIVRSEGIKGLFRGGSIIFCRDNVGYLFYIPVYESMIREFRKRGQEGVLTQIVSGGTAGVCGWISICPLEVVKNRIQAAKENENLKFKQVAQSIYQKDGIRGFFRGGLAMSVRGFVVNAVIFIAYENTIALLT